MYSYPFCIYIVADIPGLIEQAHQNKGLGHVFLRHIERCQCLLFVVDISIAMPVEEQLSILKNELKMYKEELIDLPFGVIINKIDLLTEQSSILDDAIHKVKGPVVSISALEHINIDILKDMIFALYLDTIKENQGLGNT